MRHSFRSSGHQLLRYVGMALGLAIVLMFVASQFGWDYRQFLCRVFISESVYYWSRSIGILCLLWGVLLQVFRRTRQKGLNFIISAFVIGAIPIIGNVYTCSIPASKEEIVSQTPSGVDREPVQRKTIRTFPEE